MSNPNRPDRFGSFVHIGMGILGGAAGFAAALGVVFWLVVYASNNDQTDIGGPLFTLAQVMAIFGGFGVAAGFSGNCESELKSQLRRVGALHLISALGFSLLGMTLPISSDEKIWADYGVVLGILNGVALVIAMTGFALGTTLWVGQLHKLLVGPITNGETPIQCPPDDSHDSNGSPS